MSVAYRNVLPPWRNIDNPPPPGAAPPKANGELAIGVSAPRLRVHRVAIHRIVREIGNVQIPFRHTARHPRTLARSCHHEWWAQCSVSLIYGEAGNVSGAGGKRNSAGAVVVEQLLVQPNRPLGNNFPIPHPAKPSRNAIAATMLRHFRAGGSLILNSYLDLLRLYIWGRRLPAKGNQGCQ